MFVKLRSGAQRRVDQFRSFQTKLEIKDKPKQNEFRHQRYSANLAYGSRFEPWIVSVQHMGDKSYFKMPDI